MLFWQGVGAFSSFVPLTIVQQAEHMMFFPGTDTQ